MAGRPIKTGLDYVPFDTDMEQDKKIKLLEAKHPAQGWTFWTKLLLRLYGQRGYFFEASDDNLLLLTKEISVDINSINEYINSCIRVGLFNRDLYERFRILTSKRIQITYLHATARRTKVFFIKDFLLLNLEEVKEYNAKLYFLIYDDINSIFEDNNIISDYIKGASDVISFSLLLFNNNINKGVKDSEGAEPPENQQSSQRQPVPNNQNPTGGSKKQLLSTEMRIKWTEWRQEILNSGEWLYNQQRNFGLTEEGIKEAVQKFFEYLESVEDYKDANLMKKHFVNWYPKRLMRDQKIIENNITKTAGIAKDASHYRDGWEDPK